MNFSTHEWLQPQALSENFKKHAVPLTCSPSTSAVVMATVVLGDVLSYQEKMRSAIYVGGQLLPSVSSTLTLHLTAQECRIALGSLVAKKTSPCVRYTFTLLVLWSSSGLLEFSV